MYTGLPSRMKHEYTEYIFLTFLQLFQRPSSQVIEFDF